VEELRNTLDLAEDLVESMEDFIDWKGVCEQFQAENEALRFRIIQLRESRLVDVAYYWQAFMDWATDQNHQIVLIMALSLLFPLLRELIHFIQRRRKF